MSKNEPKKHHYVPQFILKKFAQGKKKRIYVFDKRKLRFFASHVRDTGHENNFYQDDHLGYGSSTELKLSSLESSCAPILDKIVQAESISDISNEEHQLICLFVAVQIIRTNHTREFLAEFNRSMSHLIRSQGVDPNKDVSNFSEMSQSEVKSASIDILNSLPGELAKDVLNKEVVLLKAPKGHSFYISDNPIVKHNNQPREGRGNLGIGLKGIEFYFPISSKFCLHFMCSELIQELRESLRAYEVSLMLGQAELIDLSESISLLKQIDNKLTTTLNPENLEFHNSLQVIQSSRFVYSNTSSFELAKDMMKTNPEIQTQSNFVSNQPAF
ncbi:TPA: DUF4238 domain-containing protein [Vibrio parahaemolyticus]|nr:DUF4238 domain-containing protein [Vibrio parahaemolyticus]BDP34865.1 hypothetical protein VA208B3_12360 [Vibrio alginolyticus]MDG2600510.1 DUF4238 domain-containing protein [Vibrio parahaemolyticus]MEA5305495.1 DUF4238 domain-containing protein [Vibrio parahaemolyticus]WOO26460.1 DUF4238 domain-containing protein [Vibrio parahaemolyticus]HBN6274652.1 DUF4238 domain-containing protein [Vibrio parahaemolyticus]